MNKMKTINRNWFEADVEGLRAIQLGKPKFYAIREILQNAFDESITECNVTITYTRGKSTITIEDNSPIGFRDLKDSYTLFKNCYKRPDPTKRGRFNFGEKQAFSICESAIINTTSGTVIFDETGRHETNEKRKVGTEVSMIIEMTSEEYAEIFDYIKKLIVPVEIKFTLNSGVVKSSKPIQEFETKLLTELLKNNRMMCTRRNTKVSLHKPESKSYLYEMGIPICEIECQYSIDVNQRVPMSSDRDTVSQAYLQDLFAEVLNHTYKDLTPEQSSSLWVRDASSDERITKDAVQQVIKQRYGDKVVVASPTDRISIDDAISKGYKVIYGTELSKEEWKNIRDNDVIQSSHEMFGKDNLGYDAELVEPNENMQKVAEFAKYIQKKVYGVEITVQFVKNKNAKTLACYGDRTLTFNASKLGMNFFESDTENFIVDSKILDLIIHELGHECGMHTQIEYHNAITKLGAELTMMALNNPELFHKC